MPTQHDFRAAATSLRTLATTAGASAVAVNDVSGNIGIVGGSAPELVGAAINATFLNAKSVETASNSVATDFDARAEVCAKYTADMREWRARMSGWQSRWSSYLSELSVNPDAVPPGFQPPRPRRWPLWVEEG